MTAKMNLAKTFSPKMTRITRAATWLGLCALILSSVLLPATASAQSEPAAPTTPASSLQLESREGSLHLQWQGGVQAAATGATSGAKSYGGYLLPLETVMVELPADQVRASALSAVAVEGISSTPYTGEVTLAPTYEPPALDYVPSPTNQPYIEPQMPTAPLFVIREGLQRGQPIAVLGFSPIYQDPASGQIMAVDSFSASIAGATVVTESDPTADPNNANLFAPVSALADAQPPTNPFANTTAYKLAVSQVGVQQVSGASLAAAGLASPQASKVRVFYKGVQLPLHIVDTNSNNVINADDQIRFFAYEAGDAWNEQSVYWLTVGSQDGLRMSQRAVAVAGATARNTAYEVGRFANSQVYESTLAGGDSDNWFHSIQRVTSDVGSYDVTLPHQLPLNNALPTLLTLNLTPFSIGQYGSDVNHRVQFSTSGFNLIHNISARFTGATPFQNLAPTVSLGKAADTWEISLLKEATGRAIAFDTIDYLLPVQLNFGGKGAIFQGIDETWRYQLTNTPTNPTGGRALYDITDPRQPQRLTIPGGANFDFQDGPTARRYILTGTGTLFAPPVTKHNPVNLGGAGAAHTIYVAPTEFHATLQPLVDLRKSQGYQVRVVDPQAIYDAWSYGMVDAKAIRSFFRFAVGNWNPAPLAAVLVGDTTWDPRNYLGIGNPNIIPPYIANADPWLKYVPCDSCYGQLDDDEPTNEFEIDLWIGRFPVIDTTELNIVVNKIIDYETATDLRALWRSTSVQIADDDVRPDNTVDTAGPFVGSAEHIVSLMPSAVRQLRNYFLAATDFSNVPSELMTILDAVRPWVVDNPDTAMQRSISMMKSGVGIVTYTGHGNHWQWARTVATGNKWLFGLWEVDQLNNINTPFIAMSMTCYTSQFHIPAPNHFTLDEHLFLHGNGGAIATWGPTGFSIVPAHDTLQAGFHELLWKSPALKAKLGALTEAGYDKVLLSGTNFDVNKTYAFMGDPLTSARIVPLEDIYMPKLSRVAPAEE